jgi:hypothetical protein
MQAVRDALEKLGPEATSADILNELKRNGVEMSTKHISTYKADILRKAAAAAGHSLRPAREARAPAPRTGKGLVIDMHDILTLKGLMNRVGRDRLCTLIDVMAP